MIRSGIFDRLCNFPSMFFFSPSHLMGAEPLIKEDRYSFPVILTLSTGSSAQQESMPDFPYQRATS
jgi:hypothetical protein